jgi:hypothetical protein
MKIYKDAALVDRARGAFVEEKDARIGSREDILELVVKPANNLLLVCSQTDFSGRELERMDARK